MYEDFLSVGIDFEGETGLIWYLYNHLKEIDPMDEDIDPNELAMLLYLLQRSDRVVLTGLRRMENG